MKAAHNDWYADRLTALQSKSETTEADVSDGLVRPVLERVLNFGITEIDAQPSQEDLSGLLRRPDFICRRKGAVRATAIVEVKNLGTNLTKRTSPSWDSAPLGQLQRYLKMHRQSGNGTWGILTNGVEWIITRREGDDVRPFELTPVVSVQSLSRIQRALKGIVIEPSPDDKPLLSETDIDWLDAAAQCESPAKFVQRVSGPSFFPNIQTTQDIAYMRIVEHQLDNELLPQPVHVASLRMDFPDGLLSPVDISQALAEVKPLAGTRVVGVAYTDSCSRAVRLCRGFVSVGERLHATALIDPLLPGSRAEKQFAALSTHGLKKSAKKIVDALSSEPLHRRFHEEIGEWFVSTRHGKNELRHLIRVMFSWLLQERGVLPDNALWDQGRKPDRRYEVHKHVNWLFTEVLAKPKVQRGGTSDDWKCTLIKTVPFLNGSLFSKLSRAELPERLSNAAYLGKNGLLTILSRYDWTLHDRTGYASESALDPTMLGDMFEQLVLQTEGPRLEGEGSAYVHRKMPGGTYYTPQDVADEMVADAVAGWLTPRTYGIEWSEARELVHPAPTKESWRGWSKAVKHRTSQLLARMTILDPCCGSGVFTLAMLHALWRAKYRLSPVMTTDGRLDDLEDIIERQLYAVDIHPMAVLITRLRLFIALIDARSRHVPQLEDEPKPLPNLETRCLAADTLSVQLTTQQRIGGKDWEGGVEDLRAAREMWTAAHFPEEKEEAIREEKEMRVRLREILGEWSSMEELAWLDVDFLSVSAPPARFDIRRLFPAPPGGWDIVIGNPPYQKPDTPDVKRGSKLGYAGAKTNLYLMFIEAAVSVVREGGCVTLVVPHSIVFRRHKTFASVRHMIEDVAERIDIRTYDNMPQPLFPKLPWLKVAEHGTQNRQRATILTIRKKTEMPELAAKSRGMVASSGVIRLNASNRDSILKCTGTRQAQPAWTKQWSQAPTKELVNLLNSMRDESGPRRIHGIATKPVTFPPTAMYFISCLLEGAIDNSRRKIHLVPKDKYFWPWIGLYNSNLFHAYWLMVGDAFHLTAEEYGTIRPPEGWTDESLRRKIERVARRLMNNRTLESCHVVKRNIGDQHNINFHKSGTLGPAIIDELDHLLLEAYGLGFDPLIKQMTAIRIGSAHKFPFTLD